MSEDPSLLGHRSPITLRSDVDLTNDEDDSRAIVARATSVGPSLSRHPPRYGDQFSAAVSEASIGGTAAAPSLPYLQQRQQSPRRPEGDRARVNQNVNPYQEFPSLK